MSEDGPHSSETIYHTLREEMLNLALKPGRRISEHELCQRFSVSRTTIRSALQRLQNDGLMVVTPYKGSVVTLLDYDDIEQMIYMRVAVESAVIRDFMRICTPLLMERLNYQIQMQTTLLKSEFQARDFYETDSQLHAGWFRAAGKAHLWQIIQKSEINYTRFRMLDIVAADNFREVVVEHQQLLEIIRNNISDEVEPLMRKHLYGGIKRLRTRVESDLKCYFISHEQ